MAKLTRPSSIRVFASQALDPEITVFGSTTQSKDINLLLNGTDSERGWAAVGTNGTPPMEWFNAMGYALSYYSSYLMQQGIAEWVATQKYYVNSYAVGSDGKLYRSKTGSGETPNVGNNPTSDSVNWENGLDVGSAIHSATSKTTPVDADEIGIWDSVPSALKKVTFANLKATLKTYFDSLYASVSQLLGVGQTYQDVTASRAVSTTYTNNTGKPIQWCLSNAETAGSNTAMLAMFVDGSIVGYAQTFGGGSIGSNTIIVPNGSTYKCEIHGYASIGKWLELR